MNEIHTSEYVALSAEIAALRAENSALRAEIKTAHNALIEVMEPLRKGIDEHVDARIDEKVHKVAMSIEMQFGSAFSLVQGSGARKQENDEMTRASLQSLERRASRGAEHTARLEDRTTDLEARVKSLERP